MTDGRRLAKNTLWNFAGQAGPLVVALIAVPILIHALGKDRFGVLTLAWAAIGYFSLFDLGLGRALTQAVSAALGAGDQDRLAGFGVAALIAMFGLGLIAACGVIVASPWIVSKLHVPPALTAESLTSFYILGVSLPFVVMTAGFRGLLEAHQDFAIATALRLPLAAFNYLGPLLILPFSHSLAPMVAALALGRGCTWTAHAVVCMRRYPYLRTRRVQLRNLVPLMRIGGWMTVSNLVSPLMYSVDRFFIGYLISLAAVTYYVTPFELGTKLLLIPTAVLGVLFPALATSYAANSGRTGALIERAIRLMTVVMFLPTLLLVACSYLGLRLWVGADMARVGTPVLEWLAIGIFVNSIAQIPFAAIQAGGRPDLTAKLHLVELPIYAAGLWWLARTFGITGVAMAWTIRTTMDCVALLILATRCIPSAKPALVVPLRLFVGLAALATLPAFTANNASRVAVTAAATAVFLAVAWRWGIHRHERDLLWRLLRIPTGRSLPSGISPEA